MKQRKLVCISLVAVTLISALGFISNVRAVSGTSEWRTSNGQKYLYVSASDPYSLGYLEGQQLYRNIEYFKFFLMLNGLADGELYSDVVDMAAGYIPYIPEEQLDELEGIHDGYNAKYCLDINLDFNEIVLQHVYMELFYGKLQPQTTEGQAGCTDFAGQNTATTGEAVIGQNWDFASLFAPAVSWVLSELDGQNTVFTLRTGACLSLACGRNDQGVEMVMNLIQNQIEAEYTMPLASKSYKGLREANTVQGLFDVIYDGQPNSYGFMLIMKGNDGLITTQNRPDMTYVDTAEWLVHSNRYTVDGWVDVMIDPTYSIDRQDRGEELMTVAYEDGELTDEELIEILGDEPIISRSSINPMDSIPVAFVTSKYFGLGSVPKKIFSDDVNWNKIGICPI